MRPNKTGVDWSAIEEVRAYDRARKQVERKEHKYVIEDLTGFRVPLWVLPSKVRNAAFKCGVLFRRRIPRI